MQILEAYCVELGRVVDIYEAHHAFFALPKNNQKRFEFRCSDEACRRQNNPLVSGVNYDKLVEEDEKYRQIHFRAPPGNSHLATCVWVQGDVRRQAGDGEDIVDRDPRVERAKSTDVIDVFNPREFDALIDLPAGKSLVNRPPKENPSGPIGEPGGSIRSREGYTSTSRLERFINCWAKIPAEKRREHQVTTEGRTLTYRQAVLPSNWITPSENGTRIICGGARASLWPTDKPKRVYINFMDGCEKFAENDGGRSLAIDVPLSRIHAYLAGALMMQKIEKAQSDGHYLRVYCWGEIVARGNKPGYVVEIASLDNLVLKVIPIKKKS